MNAYTEMTITPLSAHEQQIARNAERVQVQQTAANSFNVTFTVAGKQWHVIGFELEAIRMIAQIRGTSLPASLR